MTALTFYLGLAFLALFILYLALVGLGKITNGMPENKDG